MEPRVWITQRSRTHDYSSAQEFGELRQIVTDVTDRLEVSPAEFREGLLLNIQVFKALFLPNQDYLLLAGNPLVIGTCFSAALARCADRSDRLKVLVYDRASQRYTLSHMGPGILSSHF